MIVAVLLPALLEQGLADPDKARMYGVPDMLKQTKFLIDQPADRDVDDNLGKAEFRSLVNQHART